MKAVPATGLRGWLALRLMACAEKKAAQGASGRRCAACGHDALFHEPRKLRERRRTDVPRGACYRCAAKERVGLLHPVTARCLAYADQG